MKKTLFRSFVQFLSGRSLTLLLCSGLALSVQSAPSLAKPAASDRTPDTKPSEEYKIGPGDLLTVTIADAPEFGGRFRVTDAGEIQLSGVNNPILANDLTPSELAKSIRKALMDAKQLRNPKVTVFIEEYHGRTVAVLGAVSKPAVYSLTRHTTVLDALSLAGGALANSGNTVTIVRGPASAEATGEPVGSVKIVDMARLTSGADINANVEVRNGDVINVSPAQVVYVVGAVTKPGGFVLSNPSDGVSVVQAVALAEGFTSVAATRKGLIIRQSTSAQGRREIPVDLKSIMTGKETDVVLAPNDILFVPNSGSKQTLKVMGDIGMAAVNGLAIYGLGYRVGVGTL